MTAALLPLLSKKKPAVQLGHPFYNQPLSSQARAYFKQLRKIRRTLATFKVLFRRAIKLTRQK
jgi:hypothetical protein